MKIEFDPEKNAKNIRERGLPFTLADEFDWTTAMIAPSSRHGEARFFAIGYIGSRLHVRQGQAGVRSLSRSRRTFGEAQARPARHAEEAAQGSDRSAPRKQHGRGVQGRRSRLSDPHGRRAGKTREIISAKPPFPFPPGESRGGGGEPPSRQKTGGSPEQEGFQNTSLKPPL